MTFMFIFIATQYGASMKPNENKTHINIISNILVLFYKIKYNLNRGKMFPLNTN